jgi:hypothetical protein
MRRRAPADPRDRDEGAGGLRARIRALPRPALLEWYYLVGGLFLVVHYRWLMDDAFVYFRYVDNLLYLKQGLVYNGGEYVEGFSSPLYCLILIVLRAFHISWPAIVLLVGCACFSIFWYLIVALNRDLSPKGGMILDLPLAYLAFNYGLDSFFTSGLETPLAHVMAPVIGLYLLRPRSKPLVAALALAPLVRPELALAVGLAALFSWWRCRAFPWLLLAASLVVNGSWLVFRIYYYADLLPNTFYLKDVVRLDQGWLYLAETASTYHLPAFLLGSILLAALVRRCGGRSAGVGETPFGGGERLAMLAIAGVVAAYAARVGGTHVHYWYLAFPFSLAVCSTAGIVEEAFAKLGLSKSQVVGWAAMLGLSLLVSRQYPPQLSAHPFRGDAEHEPVHFIDDALWHRRHKSLRAELLEERVSIGDLKRAGEEISTRGTPGIWQGTWCRRQYASYRLRFVHGFGLTDALLARTEASWMKPAHKSALVPLSKDIVRIQERAERIGPGMYRRAVEKGSAPRWVEENLVSIETIERKIYNRHDFTENLRLALTFPDPIAIPARPDRFPRDPIGGEFGGQSQQLEDRGDVSIVLARAVGIVELPYGSILRCHFESPTGVGFGDQRVAVGEPLRRAEVLREEGIFLRPAVLPHGPPRDEVELDHARSARGSAVVEEEQMTVVQDLGVVLPPSSPLARPHHALAVEVHHRDRAQVVHRREDPTAPERRNAVREASVENLEAVGVEEVSMGPVL